MSNFYSIASKRLALSLVSVSIFALSTNSYSATNAYSQEIVIPEQFINIEVSYDKYTDTFYDFSANGSQLLETQVKANGEILLKHGRDGWIGQQTLYNKTMSFWIDRDDFGSHALTNLATGTSFTYQAGLVRATTQATVSYEAGGGRKSSNCRIPDLTQNLPTGTLQTVNSTVNNIYNDAECYTRQYYTYSHLYTDINQAGNIERIFKIDKQAMRKAKYGTYTHSLRSTAVHSRDSLLSHVRINEYYTYNLTVNVKPGIHTVILENKDLAFNVTKYGTTVEGAAQTGYGIFGSFDKGQEFTMTFTSANAASCGGNLCLIKNKSSEPIPYTALILDPYTLVNRKITASGGKVTVYAGEEFGVSGVIRFEFIKDHAGLSGTYKDTVTVLTEIKL